MYAVSHDHLLDRQRGTGGQLDKDEDDQSILSDIRSVHSHAQQAMISFSSSRKQGGVNQTNGNIAQQRHTAHVIPPVDQKLLRNNQLASKQLISSRLDLALRSVDRQQYGSVNKDLYADIDTDSHLQLSVTNDLQRPSPAVLRSYQDVINRQIDNSTRQGATYYSLDHQRVVQSRNILVISEKQLVTVEEHLAKLVKRKNEVLRRVLECSLFSTDMMHKFKKFSIWKNSLERLKGGQRHAAMTRIQSRARVWLCRVRSYFQCYCVRK
jgi:hypothetical protein